jgi:WS/DGAT/MGAT family acyltransferase
MDAVIAEIASAPLDRRRPLWELWLLEGLAEGRVAAVGKVHHAVADGAAVAALLAHVLDPSGTRLAEPGGPTWTAERVPSWAELLRQALRERLRLLARFPALAARTARNVTAVLRRRRTLSVAPPRPLLDTPHTSLSGALTARRAFASTGLVLDEVRAVKRAFGTTLNDVLLALVADALRDYLEARGERPARALVAEVPVATDAPGSARLAGNRLSNVFTSLCTDVADPGARLRTIHEVTRAAKALHGALGPDLYEAWMEIVPPRLLTWTMRLYSRLRLADRHRPAVNVIVSCVPGPAHPLGWPGGRLEAIYSVGPVIEGAAINVTAWSYADRLCVGVLTCPDLVPDPHALAAGLHRALGRLRAADAAAPRPAA